MTENYTFNAPHIETQPKPELSIQHTEDGVVLTLPTINEAFEIEKSLFECRLMAFHIIKTPLFAVTQA